MNVTMNLFVKACVLFGKGGKKLHSFKYSEKTQRERKSGLSVIFPLFLLFYRLQNLTQQTSPAKRAAALSQRVFAQSKPPCSCVSVCERRINEGKCQK